MAEKYIIPKKITNEFVDNMIEGISENYLLREGMCGADLTECDMSELDLEHFRLLCFDEKTKFSEEQIRKFNPKGLLKQAKKPMKDIQYLHMHGINGNDVVIAIIDTNINEKYIENLYGSRVKYVDNSFKGEIEPHGATVLDSFFQTCPNASVRYYPFDKQQDKVSKADNLIDVIKQAVESGIKIISLSNTLKGIIGEDRAKKVQKYLMDNGVVLIDSDIFYNDFTYCFRDIKKDGSESFKESLCEPEDLRHKNLWNIIINGYQKLLLLYGAINIDDLKNKLNNLGKIDELNIITEFEPVLQYTEFSSGKNSPLHFLKQRDKDNEKRRRNNNIEIPCGGRTLNGKYWGTSSASYTIPVIAGIFAMCRQINPEIQYDEFVRICKDTAKIVNECNLIQPQMLIEKVRELRNDLRINQLAER